MSTHIPTYTFDQYAIDFPFRHGGRMAPRDLVLCWGMPFEAEQCDDKMFAEFMAETYDKDVMPSFKDLFPIDAWMMETLRH